VRRQKDTELPDGPKNLLHGYPHRDLELGRSPDFQIWESTPRPSVRQIIRGLPRAEDSVDELHGLACDAPAPTASSVMRDDLPADPTRPSLSGLRSQNWSIVPSIRECKSRFLP